MHATALMVMKKQRDNNRLSDENRNLGEIRLWNTRRTKWNHLKSIINGENKTNVHEYAHIMHGIETKNINVPSLRWAYTHTLNKKNSDSIAKSCFAHEVYEVSTRYTIYTRFYGIIMYIANNNRNHKPNKKTSTIFRRQVVWDRILCALMCVCAAKRMWPTQRTRYI